MSFIATLSNIITAVNELKALKVALGFKADDSVVDIIKKVKADKAPAPVSTGTPGSHTHTFTASTAQEATL